MGMPRSRHAHHSRFFVNSNWNPDLDHGPFSSPGNMKSVFQRAMAFCNKRDGRSYAQALSSKCDSMYIYIHRYIIVLIACWAIYFPLQCTQVVLCHLISLVLRAPGYWCDLGASYLTFGFILSWFTRMQPGWPSAIGGIGL